MAIKINVNFNKTEDKGQVLQPVLKPVNPLWNKNVTPSPVIPRLNVPTNAPVVPRLQIPQATTNRIQTMKESSIEPQKPTLRIPFNFKDAQQGNRGVLTAEAQRIALEQTPAPIAGTLGGIGSAFGIKNTPEQEQYLRDTKKGYGAYSVAGNIIGQIGGYGAVNAALKGTKLGATLVSTLGKKLGDKAGGYVASQGAQLLADAIVQAPMETLDAIQNDKSIAEDAKQILINRAIDLGLNMAIQGGSDAFKKMMANKKVMQSVIDAGVPESEIIRAIETNDQQAIREIQNKVNIKGKEYEVSKGTAQGNIPTTDTKPSNVKITDEVTGNYKGQTNGQMTAKIDGKPVGKVEYSVFGDKVGISYIDVDEPFRKQGVAKELLQKLQADNPTKSIDWGGTTESGTKLKEKVSVDVPNKEFTRRENRIEKYKAELEQIQKRADEGIVSEAEGDRWNFLNDAINKIEPSLRSIDKTKNYILPTIATRKELPKLQPKEQLYRKSASMEAEKPKSLEGEYTLDKKVVPQLKPVAETKTKPPIEDTRSRVMVEPQSKVKGLLRDKTERVYQELVSKNVPTEKIGGQPKVLAANLNRSQGTVEYNIGNKQTDMSGSSIGKSADEIFKGLDDSGKLDLFDYSLNKHNIDRFKQEKPVFGYSVDDVKSAETVKKYDNSNKELASKQKDITKYFDNLKREWGVKSGLISKETADMLDEMYPNYVPTYRAMDLPKGMMDYGQNVSKFLKKAKGSERYILPIDEQMKMITARTIRNARKNELMNSLFDTFKSDNQAISHYVKDVKPLPDEVVKDVLDIGKSMDEAPKINGDNYVVNFYKDGKPMQMTVNKTLYKALETVDSDDIIRQIANTVRKYTTGPMKNVITGYNPLFTASNIMRDVPTALVYSSNPIGMAKNVPDATKQMLENSTEWQRFQALGGTKAGIVGSEKSVSNTVKGLPVIKQVGAMNDFVEALPRFSEYLNVLKETGNPALAMYRAAELTTDFSRHGNLTKLVDSFVPYLNPSVQGIDRFARSVVNNPLKTATRAGLAITVPSIILDQINNDNKQYQELSPREKNLYFQVPIPNSDKFIRIPKSRELGVLFSSLYDWSARAARGEKVTGEEIAMAIKENFTPVDITSSAVWTPALKSFKQIANPDVYETNYWGSLIVPESQRQYSPGQQYDMNSSGIAKAIGKQFNVSPFVVDYFLSSYSGIIGQAIQPIGADKKTSPLTPVMKKFVTDPVMKSDNVNQFYSLLDKKTKIASDYNRKNNVDSKIVTPFEKEKNALLKVSKELSDYRKEQRALQVSDNPKRDELVRALQKKMNDVAKKAVEGSK